jgi:hypothetical protein
MIAEFQRLLAILGLDERKEGGKQKRRKITLHSFRRFVKTVSLRHLNFQKRRSTITPGLTFGAM